MSLVHNGPEHRAYRAGRAWAQANPEPFDPGPSQMWIEVHPRDIDTEHVPWTRLGVEDFREDRPSYFGDDD
jgi:hypothetical protein